MKTKFFIALVALTTFFTSCKNDKSVDSLEVVKPEVIVQTFKVILEVVVKKDDDFSLYYTTDGTTDFTKIIPIWLGVKGNENIQKVVYSLPEKILPTQLRLDFGMKQDQEDIVLKSVTLDYFGKKRTFIGPELGNFFRADDSKCSFDPTTGLIKAIDKDGKRLFPSLYPQESQLGPEISKLVK